jgi:hypothetical protein
VSKIQVSLVLVVGPIDSAIRRPSGDTLGKA